MTKDIQFFGCTEKQQDYLLQELEPLDGKRFIVLVGDPAPLYAALQTGSVDGWIWSDVWRPQSIATALRRVIVMSRVSPGVIRGQACGGTTVRLLPAFLQAKFSGILTITRNGKRVSMRLSEGQVVCLPSRWQSVVSSISRSSLWTNANFELVPSVGDTPVGMKVFDATRILDTALERSRHFDQIAQQIDTSKKMVAASSEGVSADLKDVLARFERATSVLDVLDEVPDHQAMITMQRIGRLVSLGRLSAA